MKRVPARTRSGRPIVKVALSLAALLPGVVVLNNGAFAQDQTPAPAPTTPAAPATPAPAAAPAQPIALPAQPSAPTPPTPLPKSRPNTDVTGVKPEDVRATRPFAADPGQPQPGAPEAVLTLEDALRIAMENNPNIKLATETAVRTSNTVDQIRATSSPQINASATYARFFSAASAGATGFGGASPGQLANPFGIGLQITPPGTVPVTISSNNLTNTSSSTASNSTGITRAEATRQTSTARSSSYESNNLSGRIGVSQLIDITGIVRVAIQFGELQEAQSRLELARTRQELALNVRTGYFNILRAVGFVEVNEAAVAQAQENLRVTEAQLAAGVVSNFDVLRARTQLDNNRQALISSRNQVNVAKNAFANLIGLDPSTPIEPAPPAETPVPNLQETELITQAFAMRPEYLEADVNILKAQKNIRLAHRGQEPYLNVGVNGVVNGTSGVPSDQRFAVAAGATLVFPLSDGGATRAAVANARSDERSARIQKDQFTRGIKAEVQQSVVAVRDARERLDVVGATVEQATEALRLANVRYQAGVGTQLEINDAQTALTQARTNAVNARYDYLGALARLSRAVGVPE